MLPGLLLFLFVGSLPQYAVSQPGPKKNFYRILVTQEQGACTYEIEGEADQDGFSIEPHGIVDFQAVGTDAQVDIESSDAGVGGTEGDKALKLRDGKAPKSLRARGRLQRSTQHKVHIRCCDGFKLFGSCSGEQEAQARGGTTGALAPRLFRKVTIFLLPERDGTALPALPRRLRGGPIMKVDEG